MSAIGAATLAAIVGSGAFGWRLAGAVMAPPPGQRRTGERCFVATSWALLLLSWLGIVLAEAGVFGAVGLFLGVVLAVLMAWRARPSLPSGNATGETAVSDATWLAWVAAIVLTGTLATPLVEARFEARDAGIYRLTAARLQHGGSLTYRDELVASMPPDLRVRLFPVPEGRTASRGMGFYLQDPVHGLVTPQFQPLASVLMATGRLLAGPRGADLVVLVVAALGLVGLYLVGRQLAGIVVGLLAMTWTGLSVVDWWFVRYGNAESFALLFACIGLYALARERRDDVVAAGVMAGWAFGLLWLTKLEMLQLGLPLAALFAYDIGTARIRLRSTQAFWGVLFVMAGHFFVHAWGWSYPYVRDVLLIPGVTLTTVTSVAAILLLVAIGLWIWCVRGRYCGWRLLCEYDRAGRLQQRVNGAIWAILVGLLVFGYQFRVPSWDSDNVRQLGWVISEAGLVMAIVGAGCWMMSRRRQVGSGAGLGLIVTMTALVLYNRQIIPALLWAYRRDAVFALPTFLLLAAVGVVRLGGFGVRRAVRPSGIVGRVTSVVVLLAVVVAAGAITAREIRFVQRYQGAHDLQGASALIAQLRRALEPDALVIFEPRTRRGLLRLEGVLQQEFGLDIVRLQEPLVDRRLVEYLVFSASRAGRPVYLMTSGYLVSPGWLDGEFSRRFVLDTRVLEEPGEGLPGRQLRLYLDARLYRLRPGGRLADLDGRLDVGGADDLYLDGRTVHQVEIESGGRSYRWTYADGCFYLPGLTSAARRILIRMASSYPPERGQQRVRVRLDGTELGGVVVRRGWNDYSFDIPPGWEPADESSPALEIVAEPVWRPAEMLATSDPRDVGVAVDLIRWGQ